MNEAKQKQAKGQKVGADGLTKKQRRALRIEGKKSSETANEEHSQNGNEISKIPSENKLKEANKNIKGDDRAEEKSCNKIVQNNDPKISKIADGKSKEVNKDEVKSDEKIEEKPYSKVVQKEDSKHTKTTDTKIVNKEKSEESNTKSEGLSKAELRAQRRAIQEAQRLAKQQKQEKPENSIKNKPTTNDKLKPNDKPKVNDKPILETKQIPKVSQKIVQPKPFKVQLFSHLSVATKEKGSVVENKIHPAFVRLGAQYASKTILGSNARCLALLSALKCLISSFESPPEQEFCRSLEVVLQNCVNYLQKCRPLAVSMTNALRYFKLSLAETNTNLPDNQKQDILIKCIENYICDEIEKASEAISMKVEEKILNGDIILTYGCSSLVLRILLEAHKSKKQFRVIVVDANPLFEGKEMLRRLTNAGVQCTYVLINAISFIMNKATKVLLGAHAILANGYVMSRIGTAQVALIAKTYSKPVLVCCEKYKFSERVQTDSIVYNEVGYPGELLRMEGNTSQVLDINNPKLTLLNLLYDIIPPDLVTVVATELSFLPCTSVPVVLRIDLEKSKK